MERPFTVAIWGHYHGRNLGDELVVATLIDAIRVRQPDTRIVGISMLPDRTRADHGIEAFPINPVRSATAPSGGATSTEAVGAPSARRVASRLKSFPGARASRDALLEIRRWAREVSFIPRSFRTLRGVDLIVVAGSGQLLDEWGTRLHPYTTFRWAWLARLRRVPMVYPSVGAGPIRSRTSAYLIRAAVEMADFISVRDKASAEKLQSIGVRRALPICPDMGFAYLDESLAPSRPLVDALPPVVAVNVFAHQDPRYWSQGDMARYVQYLDKMAAVIRAILERGWSVKLFSSQAGADSPATDDVVARLEESGHARAVQLRSVVHSVMSPDELVAEIQGSDGVITARLHPVLLSVALGIPVVGLTHNPKTSELLSAVGLGECVLDIDGFSADSLLGALDRARAWSDEEREAVAGHVADHRCAVEAQFDTLFGMVPVPDAGAPAGQSALG